MSDKTNKTPTKHQEENPVPAEGLNVNGFDFQPVIERLIKEIPSTPTIDLPKEQSAENKIDSFNENAKQAIVDAYSRSESLRLDRQKPMMVAIVIMLGVQLCAFNAVIFILLYKSFSVISSNSDLFAELLDFLKYYVGAVIVELVGLMLIVTKNTFSLHLGKMVDKLIASKKSK